LSVLFATKDWLTIAQLVPAWGRELGRTAPDPSRVEQDLQHELIEDIVNGRFDNSGPLREGQGSGLRLIAPDYKARFVTSNDLRPLVPLDPWLHHIVMMKDAVLDFARRRRVPPPSWWDARGSASDDLPASTATTSISGASSQESAPAMLERPRGRPREKFDRVRDEMIKDLKQSHFTRDELQNMHEKVLEHRYKVSRDTARKARQAVLSEYRNLSNDN